MSNNYSNGVSNDHSHIEHIQGKPSIADSLAKKSHEQQTQTYLSVQNHDTSPTTDTIHHGILKDLLDQMNLISSTVSLMRKDIQLLHTKVDRLSSDNVRISSESTVNVYANEQEQSNRSTSTMPCFTNHQTKSKHDEMSTPVSQGTSQEDTFSKGHGSPGIDKDQLMALPEECREIIMTQYFRINAFTELVSTEKTFCSILWTLIDVIAPCFIQSGVCSNKEICALIPSTLPHLYAFHINLFHHLREFELEHLRCPQDRQQLISWLSSFSHSHLENYDQLMQFLADRLHITFVQRRNVLCQLYQTYYEEFLVAMETITRLQKSSLKFKRLLQDIVQSGVCEGLDVSAYLLAPVQRMPRYRLMIQKLMKSQQATFSSHIKSDDVPVQLTEDSNEYSMDSSSPYHSEKHSNATDKKQEVGYLQTLREVHCSIDWILHRMNDTSGVSTRRRSQPLAYPNVTSTDDRRIAFSHSPNDEVIISWAKSKRGSISQIGRSNVATSTSETNPDSGSFPQTERSFLPSSLRSSIRNLWNRQSSFGTNKDQAQHPHFLQQLQRRRSECFTRQYASDEWLWQQEQLRASNSLINQPSVQTRPPPRGFYVSDLSNSQQNGCSYPHLQGSLKVNNHGTDSAVHLVRSTTVIPHIPSDAVLNKQYPMRASIGAVLDEGLLHHYTYSTLNPSNLSITTKHNSLALPEQTDISHSSGNHVLIDESQIINGSISQNQSSGICFPTTVTVTDKIREDPCPLKLRRHASLSWCIQDNHLANSGANILSSNGNPIPPPHADPSFSWMGASQSYGHLACAKHFPIAEEDVTVTNENGTGGGGNVIETSYNDNNAALQYAQQTDQAPIFGGEDFTIEAPDDMKETGGRVSVTRAGEFPTIQQHVSSHPPVRPSFFMVLPFRNNRQYFTPTTIVPSPHSRKSSEQEKYHKRSSKRNSKKPCAKSADDLLLTADPTGTQRSFSSNQYTVISMTDQTNNGLEPISQPHVNSQVKNSSSPSQRTSPFSWNLQSSNRYPSVRKSLRNLLFSSKKKPLSSKPSEQENDVGGE